DNDDDEIDIEQSSRNLSVKPLPDVINTDVGAYAQGYRYGVSWGMDTAYQLPDLAEKKSTKLVKDLQSRNLESVGVLKLQDGCSTHNVAHKLNLENY
ncbi:hypothetical protein Tco_0223135, partial [Tanacetum coccineum]